MAANVVAYPDIALEKITSLDPSEDAEVFSLIQRKIQFSLGTRDPADADLQAAYDARQNRYSVRFYVAQQPNGLKPQHQH